jgi:UDP-N-acetylglucosamine--N-acetylmuramyl-(pentapeptide) pyrophosphoryl-undecaprenol N-acetylglucosamine transferase
LVDSLWESKILKRFKPDVVMGLVVLQVATIKNGKSDVPTVIQEQNSFPGITNKLLSKKRTLYVSLMRIWNDFFPKENGFERKSVRRIYLVSSKSRGIQYFNLNESRKTLLVLGGSLGARMNQLIERSWKIVSQNVQIIWQESYISKIIKNTC